MVLTDRQRADLHAGIYEYLLCRGGAFANVASALQQADPEACSKLKTSPTTTTSTTPILEKKWTAIPRLQKKVLELERAASQMSKVHAHRSGRTNTDGTQRRMLPRLPCTHSLQGHNGVVMCVQVHPVFTVVVSGSEDGSIKVWDHESGDYLKTLKGHTNTVNSLDFNASGEYLASCSTDLSIKLWDFSTYSCLRTLRGHDHTISCIRFLLPPKNETQKAQLQGYLVSASRDHTVKVWDAETGFCEHTLSEHSDWVRCLAVKEGLFCSSGNDSTIFVHDANSRDKVGELRGHEHVVESLAFLNSGPDGNKNEAARGYLASGGRDRTVRLWNITSSECLAIFRQHENWVRAVLIHPSGNYVISAGDDRSIRVYDIKVRDILCVNEKKILSIF
jgi:platelet-activating factor acetylhydrolase IB subunit alpha